MMSRACAFAMVLALAAHAAQAHAGHDHGNNGGGHDHGSNAGGHCEAHNGDEAGCKDHLCHDNVSACQWNPADNTCSCSGGAHHDVLCEEHGDKVECEAGSCIDDISKKCVWTEDDECLCPDDL